MRLEMSFQLQFIFLAKEFMEDFLLIRARERIQLKFPFGYGEDTCKCVSGKENSTPFSDYCLTYHLKIGGGCCLCKGSEKLFYVYNSRSV